MVTTSFCYKNRQKVIHWCIFVTLELNYFLGNLLPVVKNCATIMVLQPVIYRGVQRKMNDVKGVF